MRKYLQRLESSPEDLDLQQCLAEFNSGLNPERSLYLQNCASPAAELRCCCNIFSSFLILSVTYEAIKTYTLYH